MPTNEDNTTLTLGGVFGSTKRSGTWQVPAKVQIKRRFGSAELDLTEAVLAGNELSFEIDMVGGSIELLRGPRVGGLLGPPWPAHCRNERNGK